MAILVPSILEKNKQDFDSVCNQVMKVAGVERIHVDFCDGKFVANNTVSVEDLDLLSPAFEFEAHLMLDKPSDFLDYKLLGFKIVIIHMEAFPNLEDLISALEAIKIQGLESGVAIKPGTPVEELKKISHLTNFFQIMGVEPGFQGAPFVEVTPERVKELRSLLPNAIIEVDGGVKMETISKLFNAGADILNAGSALVKTHDMQDAYNKLSAEIKK